MRPGGGCAALAIGCDYLWTWAGAFGGIALEEAQKLRRDVLFRVGSATSHDKAVPLALEVFGYAMHATLCSLGGGRRSERL